MILKLFQPPWIYCLAAAYFPVVSRLLLFFIHDHWWGVRHLNCLVGRFELTLGWLRDYTMIPLSAVVMAWRLYGWSQGASPSHLPLEMIFLGLSIYARWYRWQGLEPLQEFARLNPRVHPSEFFEHLYGRLGFLPHPVPLKASRVINPDHLDFRKNKKSKQSFFIFLRGVYDTFLFVTLAYKAYRWKGAHYIRQAGSGLSLVWASRMAQIARMEVVVNRSPELEKIKGGKKIFAINHKSVFDFGLAPLAYLRENADGSAASFMPSLMVAKDHFKDNFFLYKIVGLGKMLEAWGMIFVDRKSKAGGKAKAAVGLAVKKLIASDMAFSIYPQGTRALGQLARDGGRWDAGYFCVGRKERLQKEGGHFKKGVAYIAVDTALSLIKHEFSGEVWIIPVGMLEVGTTCPKKGLKIQTEVKVTIKLGEPLRIGLEDVDMFKEYSYRDIREHANYQMMVDGIVKQVDKSLQQLLAVGPRLERRFFIDLNDIVGPRGVDEVAVAFKEWRNEGELIYVILDCVYALPMKFWYPFLGELANLLRQDCSRDDLAAFRNRIAECF